MALKKHYNICSNEGCFKYGIFRLHNEKKYYCRIHKTPEMSNYRNIKCEHIGCIQLAHYNIKGPEDGPRMKPIYCKTHKTPNMVNTKNKLCNFIDCIKYATYYFPGEKPLYCFIHKKPDMIYKKYNKCKGKGCKKTHILIYQGPKLRNYVIYVNPPI
jgi:hypothetical protein